MKIEAKYRVASDLILVWDDGFRWDARDLSEVLSEVRNSDVQITARNLADKLIEMGVLIHAGSQRSMMGAQAGPKFDEFRSRLDSLLDTAEKNATTVTKEYDAKLQEIARVAQLVRAGASKSPCRGFESPSGRQVDLLVGRKYMATYVSHVGDTSKGYLIRILPDDKCVVLEGKEYTLPIKFFTDFRLVDPNPIYFLG